MNSHQTCFFCCKSIKNVTQLNSESITICDTKAVNIISKEVKKSILQISQYLKVPRNLVVQLQEENDLVLPLVCKNCEKISKTLGKLCREVEVTKMRICHYLNLLTDRIIGIKNDAKQQVNKPEIQFSELQQHIHKKCLLKVRIFEDKIVPQVILTNCQAGSSKPPQFELDDFEQDDYPVILEAEERQIKSELLADDNPELHSCPFCNFTVNCGDQLHCHISIQHSDQFENYTTTHLNSNPAISQVDSVKGTVHLSNSRTKVIVKCEICGLKIQRGSLARHKRIKHTVGYHKKRPQTLVKCDFCPLTFITRWNKEMHMKAVHLRPAHQLVGWKKVRKCEICGAMVATQNLARHKKIRHQNINKNMLGIRIRNTSKQTENFDYRTIGMENNLVKNSARRQRVDEHNKTMKKCEICGLMIHSRNISRHRRTKHPNASKIDISTDEQRKVLEEKMKFKCVVCGNGYLIRSSLQRHYRRSEKCGMERDLRMENNERDGNIEMRSTTEIIVEDEEEIVVENLLEIAEDPLKI